MRQTERCCQRGGAGSHAGLTLTLLSEPPTVYSGVTFDVAIGMSNFPSTIFARLLGARGVSLLRTKLPENVPDTRVGVIDVTVIVTESAQYLASVPAVMFSLSVTSQSHECSVAPRFANVPIFGGVEMRIEVLALSSAPFFVENR